MCGKSMSNSKFLYFISPGGRERGLPFKKEGGARTFHGFKAGLVLLSLTATKGQQRYLLGVPFSLLSPPKKTYKVTGDNVKKKTGAKNFKPHFF